MLLPRPLVLTLAIASLLPAIGSAETWYVSPSGSDSAAGTLSQPWRTAAKAAGSVSPGDIVYFRSGTWNERLIPASSGEEGSLITFASYPREAATFSGAGIPLGPDSGLIDLTSHHHIRISGLRVIDSEAAGIYAEHASNLVIDHCTTGTTGESGIGIWNSSDITIEWNEVVAACMGGMQEHITVAGTQRFVVSNNHVHDVAAGTEGKEGICLKDGASNGVAHHNEVDHLNRVGIYVDAWDKQTHDIDVFANVVHDNRAMGFSIACEMGGTLENIRLFNNIAWSNMVGIWVSGCCPPGDPRHRMVNVSIVNNTLAGNGYEPWGGGLAVENEDIEGLVVRNNLLSGNLTFQLAANAALPAWRLTVDHNLIDGFRQSEGEILGDAFLEGDPRFRDAPAHDFHLTRGSPAIDAGSAEAAPATDFEGRSRPRDGNGDGVRATDVGAFEFSIGRTRPVRR